MASRKLHRQRGTAHPRVSTSVPCLTLLFLRVLPCCRVLTWTPILGPACFWFVTPSTAQGPDYPALLGFLLLCPLYSAPHPPLPVSLSVPPPFPISSRRSGPWCYTLGLESVAPSTWSDVQLPPRSVGEKGREGGQEGSPEATRVPLLGQRTCCAARV